MSPVRIRSLAPIFSRSYGGSGQPEIGPFLDWVAIWVAEPRGRDRRLNLQATQRRVSIAIRAFPGLPLPDARPSHRPGRVALLICCASGLLLTAWSLVRVRPGEPIR